jgi:hypothetical protein
MKTIELKGGPFDGESLQFSGAEEAAFEIIAAGHPDLPVYRCSCCACCAAQADVVEYHFIGYEISLRKAMLERRCRSSNEHKRN